ncbi:MAG: hypothetical protein MUF87_12475 [Anaerolineae bacterium]|jgi:hypothetical protein|nr:hypothetical protein [Anaerolineae bacterium]
MISIELWRIFYDSLPRHPLFWRTFVLQAQPTAPHWRTRLVQASGGLFIVVLGCVLWWVFIPLFGITLIAVMAGGLFAGINSSSGVAQAIAAEHEQGRYDLLILSPGGRWLTAWVLATRYLRTNRTTIRLNRLTNIFHIICAGVVLLSAVTFLLSNLFLESNPSGVNLTLGLIQVFTLFGLIIAVHLDFRVSVVLGALIGMIMPLRKRLDAALISASLFVGIKIAMYIGYFLILSVYGANMSGILSGLGGAILAILLVITSHELLLQVMWRQLPIWLNTQPEMLWAIKKYA